MDAVQVRDPPQVRREPLQRHRVELLLAYHDGVRDRNDADERLVFEELVDELLVVRVALADLVDLRLEVLDDVEDDLQRDVVLPPIEPLLRRLEDAFLLGEHLLLLLEHRLLCQRRLRLDLVAERLKREVCEGHEVLLCAEHRVEHVQVAFGLVQEEVVYGFEREREVQERAVGRLDERRLGHVRHELDELHRRLVGQLLRERGDVGEDGQERLQQNRRLGRSAAPASDQVRERHDEQIGVVRAALQRACVAEDGARRRSRVARNAKHPVLAQAEEQELAETQQSDARRVLDALLDIAEDGDDDPFAGGGLRETEGRELLVLLQQPPEDDEVLAVALVALPGKREQRRACLELITDVRGEALVNECKVVVPTDGAGKVYEDVLFWRLEGDFDLSVKHLFLFELRLLFLLLLAFLFLLFPVYFCVVLLFRLLLLFLGFVGCCVVLDLLDDDLLQLGRHVGQHNPEELRVQAHQVLGLFAVEDMVVRDAPADRVVRAHRVDERVEERL